MDHQQRLPATILGGDPFNHQFRFLYRKDLWWRLHDEDYCLEVMRAAYEAGGRAYDLSFSENVRLLERLAAAVDDALIGFGNPTWDQGVMFGGRFIFFIRDRIIRTLVERIWDRSVAQLVKEKLSQEDVLVFGYDQKADLLTEEEIAAIHLDEVIFRQRLSTFKPCCQYICFGGSDADYLVSLGRMDVVAQMLTIVKSEGYIPILLCQYPSLVLPAVEAAGLEVAGYALPLNRAWSWFDRDSCVKAVKATDKLVIAFMALASKELRRDVRGALDWLYREVGVESVLFGTATPEHARETTRIALEVRKAADASKSK